MFRAPVVLTHQLLASGHEAALAPAVFDAKDVCAALSTVHTKGRTGGGRGELTPNNTKKWYKLSIALGAAGYGRQLVCVGHKFKKSLEIWSDRWSKT